MQRIVIVGAGMAGGRAASELRAGGFAGEVVLLGAEPHRPYDRPPLSKAVLHGRTDDTTLPFDLDRVDLRLDRRATGLRPGTVETDAGPLDHDGLVLAVGADPVTLPGDGRQRVLRTIDDARGLRAALRPGTRLAIVGAGWIGAEVATAAAAIGAEVTVVEAAGAPLLAALGAQVGALTVDWYAQAGVTLRLDTAVERVTGGGLLLADGEELVADEVVVGVGARPNVGWLAGSGLALDRGVVVDEHLAARWTGAGGAGGGGGGVAGAGAGGDGADGGPGGRGAADAAGPPVVAVGDCAAWWSGRYGRRLRVEHWDCAQQSPAVAVTTLLGGDAVYDPVPYFWSEQFGRMVQFAGMVGENSTPVFRGDPQAVAPPDAKRPPGWSAGWFAHDGRLVALVTVGRPADMVAGRRSMTAGGVIDQERFADISVPMKELVAAS